MSRAVVIGGGFFGASIAIHLKTKRGFGEVVLIERETQLLGRASFTNQARVHGGYHYLRSFTTAYRSRVNFARFCADFPTAVTTDYQSIYALAARQTKVSPRQVERFCGAIGAPLEPLPDELWPLFDRRRISHGWLTAEKVFDANVLRRELMARLHAAGVQLRLGCHARSIEPDADGVRITLDLDGHTGVLQGDYAFNCTYSNLQHLAGPGAPDFRLMHEIAELVLIEPPVALAGIGVTVMDGPFFSTLPFPARGLHSLSHVRYTPHFDWTDHGETDPADRLTSYERGSSVDWMLRDASRYMPALAASRPVETLFEVKTVLLRNAGDDGRPILFERHGAAGRIVSILGGKIDNIYDALDRLDQEDFPCQRLQACAD